MGEVFVLQKSSINYEHSQNSNLIYVSFKNRKINKISPTISPSLLNIQKSKTAQISNNKFSQTEADEQKKTFQFNRFGSCKTSDLQSYKFN
jgi:hypothetical protein